MCLKQASPIRILFLEDQEKDAELVQELLSSNIDSMTFTWLKSKAEYLAALKTSVFDIIISDYTLPNFNGLEALTFALEICPNTPFICVSGTIDEEAAVELLTSGAVDYIIKDRLQRLPKAVMKALEVARIKSENLIAIEEIKQLNIDLEKRVRERTIELEDLNRDLESFSFSISHDLRSFLCTIDGFSKILSEDYGDKLDENGLSLIATIRKGVSRMNDLIESLMRLSRVIRKDLKYVQLDMTEIAQNVYEYIADDETKKTLKFSLDPLTPVVGDKALISQVWANLISNAIKYTKPVPDQSITIGSSNDLNSATYFIKDNGVGFDMEKADKLFGVFCRLHSRNDFEGIGIGLANVKRVVNRHGGSVWAESAVNEGSTFYFKLPSLRNNYVEN